MTQITLRRLLIDTMTSVHPLSPCMWPACPLLADHGLFVEVVLLDGSHHREHLHFCFQHYPKFTQLPASERGGILTTYLDRMEATN